MRVELTLICDDPGCTRQRGAAAQTEYLAFRRLVEEAISEGWYLTPAHGERTDYCPDHNPERKLGGSALG